MSQNDEPPADPADSASHSETQRDDKSAELLELTPPTVADHELIRIIGSGAYGDVWLARNIMGVYRAVKIIYRARFNSDRPYEREYAGIERFEPISRSHESQVNILHIGRANGCFFYVMELADPVESVKRTPSESPQIDTKPSTPGTTNGSSHATRTVPIAADVYQPRTMRSEFKLHGRLPLNECLEFTIALTRALDHLHSNGLVHRDIKPSNIIFVNGRPKLADIGLVAESDATISYVGTEGYIPPEGPGKPQADIYSLGKTIYEFSTGRDRNDFPELPTFLNEEGERAGLAELNEVILRACEENPTDRYRSAIAMQEDLIRIQSGKSVRRQHLLERYAKKLRKVAVFAFLALGVLATYSYLVREGRRLSGLEASKTTEMRAHDAIRAGNHAESLPLIAQAWQQAEGSPSEEDRLNRLASSALDLIPKPLQFWNFPDGVQNAQYHPDTGDLLVVTGTEVVVLDGSNGSELRRFGNGETIQQFEISKTGFLSAITFQNTPEIQVWNWRTGKPVSVLHGHEVPPTEILFAAETNRLISGGADGLIRVWDTSTGDPVFKRRYQDPLNEVVSMALSPDGRTLAATFLWPDFVGLEETVLRVFDINSTNSTNSPLAGKKHSVTGGLVDFSPDGRWLVMLRGNRGLHLYNTRDWAAVDELPRFENRLHGMKISPDSRTLVVHESDGTIRSYNLTHFREIARRKVHAGPIAQESVRFSPDGTLLTAASEGGHFLKLFNSRTLEQVGSSIPVEATVTRLDFHPTLPLLVAAEAGSGNVRTWDYRFGGPKENGQLDNYFLTVAEWNPTTASLLLGYAGGPSWGTPGSEIQWRHPGTSITNRRGPVLSGFVTHGAVDAPGQKAILATWLDALEDGQNRRAFWVLSETGGVRRLALETTNSVKKLEFSRDARRCLVTTGRDLHVIDVDSGNVIRSITPDVNKTISVGALNAGGTRVAGATTSNELMVWNIESDRLEWSAESSTIHQLEWSPLNDRLISMRSKAVDIWTFAGVGPHREEVSHDGAEIYAMATSPDGGLLLTSGADRQVRLWDLGSSLCRASMELETVASSLGWAPDGTKFLTIETDQLPHTLARDGSLWFFTPNGQRTRVWQSDTFQQMTIPLPHLSAVRLAGFDSGGENLLVMGADGSVKRWDVKPRLNSKEELSVQIKQNIGTENARGEGLPLNTDKLTGHHRGQAEAAQAREDWHALKWHARRLLAVDSGDALNQSFLMRASDRGFPSRVSGTSSNAIDLSSYYNVPLSGFWRPGSMSRNGFGVPGWQAYFNFARWLPPGRHQSGKVEFDVRGFIALDWDRREETALQFARDYPRTIQSIPIQKQALKIHFLHTTFLPFSEKGTPLGQYVVHYADGSKVKTNLIFGENIDAFAHSTQCSVPNVVKLVDTPDSNDTNSGAGHHLHILSWENPNREKIITHLDFESSMSITMPVMCAITIEPLDP